MVSACDVTAIRSDAKAFNTPPYEVSLQHVYAFSVASLASERNGSSRNKDPVATYPIPTFVSAIKIIGISVPQNSVTPAVKVSVLCCGIGWDDEEETNKQTTKTKRMMRHQLHVLRMIFRNERIQNLDYDTDTAQ